MLLQFTDKKNKLCIVSARNFYVLCYLWKVLPYLGFVGCWIEWMMIMIGMKKILIAKNLCGAWLSQNFLAGWFYFVVWIENHNLQNGKKKEKKKQLVLCVCFWVQQVAVLFFFPWHMSSHVDMPFYFYFFIMMEISCWHFRTFLYYGSLIYSISPCTINLIINVAINRPKKEYGSVLSTQPRLNGW